MIFSSLIASDPDPILGITAAFRADPHPDKIDLGVGVFKDESNRTPIFKAVRIAEQSLLSRQNTKDYIGISGNQLFSELLAKCVLGTLYPQIHARVALLQTTGGSGALRVASELIQFASPFRPTYLITPTWPNHYALFSTERREVKEIPSFGEHCQLFDFSRVCEAMDKMENGSVVVFQASCHNPTGLDPTIDQWETLAEIVERQNILPVLDLAYQGLGSDLDSDAAAVRSFANRVPELLVAVSCSKNFGLYRERTGLLMAVANSANEAQIVRGHIERIGRRLYSMPPDHGAAIVAAILADDGNTTIWQEELDKMRLRINEIRLAFSAALSRHGLAATGVRAGHGMFSLLPVSQEGQQTLRTSHHIYIGPGGRINIAGLPITKIDTIAKAFSTVCP